MYHCQKETKSRKKRGMNKLNFIKCFFMRRITSVWIFFSDSSPRNFVFYPKTRQMTYRTLPTIIWA